MMVSNSKGHLINNPGDLAAASLSVTSFFQRMGRAGQDCRGVAPMLYFELENDGTVIHQQWGAREAEYIIFKVFGL